MLLPLPAIAADIPDPLPDPDGEAADMSKPVQIYVLLGQSNMVGAGRISQGGASNSHYGGNAATYMNVDEAMDKAMVELMKSD